MRVIWNGTNEAGTIIAATKKYENFTSEICEEKGLSCQIKRRLSN